MMDFEMISYILEVNNCEYEEVKCGKQTWLYNVRKITTININDTEMDIDDFDYLDLKLDTNSHDIVILRFFKYVDFGDSGYDLVDDVEIRTKLSKLEQFMLQRLKHPSKKGTTFEERIYNATIGNYLKEK